MEKSPAEMEAYIREHKKDVDEELADVLYWALLISHDFRIKVLKMLDEKMKVNEVRYSVKKTKGRSMKYGKL
jgi:dCTP diphosphatase